MGYSMSKTLVLTFFGVIIICAQASAWQRTVLPIILFNDPKVIEGFYFELDIDYALNETLITDVDCERNPIACAIIPVVTAALEDDLNKYKAELEKLGSPKELEYVDDAFRRFRQYLGLHPTIKIQSISRIGIWHHVRLTSRIPTGEAKELTLVVRKDGNGEYHFAHNQAPDGPQRYFWAGIVDGLDFSWGRQIAKADLNMTALPLYYYGEPDPDTCARLYVSTKLLSADLDRQIMIDYSKYCNSLLEVKENAEEIVKGKIFPVDNMHSELKERIEKNLEKRNSIPPYQYLRQEFAFLTRPTSPVMLVGEGNDLYCVISSDNTATYRLLPTEKSEQGYLFGGGGYGTGGTGDAITAIFNETEGALLNQLMVKIELHQ